MSMKRQLACMREFADAFSAHREECPTTDIPEEVKQLRILLMTEELAEVIEAIEQNDLLNLTKELADLLYVLLGTVQAFGLESKFEAVFDEVHRSNMSKLDDDGKPILRADGKALKSENYFKPDLGAIFDVAGN